MTPNHKAAKEYAKMSPDWMFADAFKAIAQEAFEAGQKSILDRLPSEVQSERARWEEISNVMKNTGEKDSWTACYKWIKSKLEQE